MKRKAMPYLTDAICTDIVRNAIWIWLLLSLCH